MESAYPKRTNMNTIVVFCLLAVAVVQTQGASHIGSRFTFQGIRKTRQAAEEDVLKEVKEFLDWLITNNSDKIFVYQNEALIPKRTRYDVVFDLQYLENVEIVSFMKEQLAVYKNLNPFTAIVAGSLGRIRKGADVTVFGDPHVKFEHQGETFCFDTVDPLNETLELYEATSLGIKLNIDFRSDRPDSPANHTWIHDVAVLSPDVTVTVNKSGIFVEYKKDGTQKSLAWGGRDSLETNTSNTYVSVNNQQMLFLKYADEDSDVERVEIGVFRAQSGSLDLRYKNEDGLETSGFVPSLTNQIGSVNVDTLEPNTLDLKPVWDEDKIFQLHRYKGDCWKITDGAHQLFENPEDWQKFVRGCLTCES